MDTSTEQHYEIIVLGAGAAGLMCAITAAKRGRRVLVLEKSNKPGKKILMSGGGRCNFTNLYVEPENYISENPHFCKSALNSYSQWDFISLIEEHQIPHAERKHGQLFCRDSAKEILAMLLELCREAGVEIRNRIEVLEVNAISQGLTDSESTSSRYGLRTETNIFNCDSLIIATGALSIPTLGGSGFGYELAKQLSLKMTDLSAGLVPLTFSDSTKGCCERLAGLSLPVEITAGKQAFTEDLLFTHRGISGPVVLQISNYWRPGESISVDLLPLIDSADWLLEAKSNMASSLLRTVLAQVLPRALVLELQTIWWKEVAEQPLAEISDRILTEIGRKLNGWRLKPSGTEGYRTAEVTLGGVNTDELNAKTMEAKNHPGLFFIGEVVDVSGHLGGFNFQWAWSSGFVAGSVV
ncbi:MAG: putative Rossmann fold flavoprotein [Porticoccaceae bacterium]|jgi:predicted Rossmann fold flavoprotein